MHNKPLGLGKSILIVKFKGLLKQLTIIMGQQSK